jgi:hypothetical protein
LEVHYDAAMPHSNNNQIQKNNRFDKTARAHQHAQITAQAARFHSTTSAAATNVLRCVLYTAAADTKEYE